MYQSLHTSIILFLPLKFISLLFSNVSNNLSTPLPRCKFVCGFILPNIFSYFVDYASRRQNNVPVKVTVSEEPNKETKNKVSLFVSQKMGHNTPIKYEINKTMLGGVVLKYKDNEIDLSVDNKLDGLNSVLTN